MSSVLELNCLVLGDDPSHIFPVEINKNKLVGTLKEAIKDKNKHAFEYVDAKSLMLWKVHLSIDENLKETVDRRSLTEKESLSPVTRLLKIFPERPEDEHLHIVIKCPPHPPPSKKHALSTTPQSEDSVGDLRRSYLKQFPKNSPSQLGQPSQIKYFQTSAFNKFERFCCNRPPSAAPTIPVTLLHPIFNEFKDDCRAHQPTKEDNALALELSIAMSCFFEDEKARQTEFIRILCKHGINITPTEIVGTSCCTDGDMRSNGFPYFIVEIKLDMGSKGAEPVFQAAVYYNAHLRSQAHLNPHFTYPCLVLYLIGSTFGFVGLAFTDRANIQVLGPAIRLDYHYTDNELPTMAARYLGALRNATDKLRRHYDEVKSFEPPHPGTTPDAIFPCYTRYTCLIESVERDIQYLFQPYDDKLFFVGKSDGIYICVKFVTRYSKEAHEHCASRSIAPKLRGFEALPGGWFMVVMNSIAEEFVHIDTAEYTLTSELHDMVLKETNLLHKAGYVHGDLRDINLMVREDGQPGFMLLDFDWAGKIGEVCYPRNVNTGPDLWRPTGAHDGELIKAEHDIAMIRHIFQAV